MERSTLEHATARAGSKALIREINEALVLDVIRRKGVASRAEVTAVTGLSPATVTGITGQLVGAGLLTERDTLRGTGGRPARLLELGTDAVLAAGVRISASAVDVALVNLRGDVVSALSVPVSDTTPEKMADAVAAAIEEAAAGRGDALRGASITLSGIVDRRRGVVRHSGALAWQGVAFADLVARNLGRRVTIDNLVNSLATGLLLRGDELAEREVMVFSAGVSLGASMLIRGRIHRGYGGAAGGFAHSAIGLRDSGRPCHCGDDGCLETWSSLWGMRREGERRGEFDDAILTEGGARLGAAMANASKMLAPEHVVLALSPDVQGGAFLDACRVAFTREYRYAESPAPELVAIPADGDVFTRGAGYDMITELFTSEHGV
ncbi:MAG: ROK family protein [Microbacterium sp.]|jgi:predicted NBD/HSP70 family sugar kinase|nr:ROK family protein [Microbacterium sp.]